MRTATVWTPTIHEDYDALKGTHVFSADGEKVGTIGQILHPRMEMPAARGRHYFLLEPGLLQDWFGGFDKVYLPESVIEDVAPDRVTLNLSSTQIKQRGNEWTTEPSEIAEYRRS